MAVELELKKANWIQSTREYLTDVRSEMRRVTWPSRKQVESTTVVVILSVFVFAAYFEIIDKFLQSTVQRAYNFLIK
jgi:preprotein translocase subunit SecE